MKKINLQISAVPDRDGSIYKIRYDDISASNTIGNDKIENNIESYQKIKNQCNRFFEQITLSTKTFSTDKDLSNIISTCSYLSELLFGECIQQLEEILLVDDEICFLMLDIDDDLSNIPWECVLLNNAFLWERFYISRSLKGINITGHSNNSTTNEKLKMWVIADPRNNLEQARNEAEKLYAFIARINEIEFSRGSEINTEQFKQKIRNNWGIVHFAGHVAYQKTSDIIKAGIGLSDAFICSDDIEKMAGHTKFPELIFINSCHSAHSQVVNEDMINLAKSFIKGGPNHFIGTFCELGDDQAKDFAIKFYHSLLVDHLTVGESLYCARKFLFSTGKIACLNYVMYGAPDHKYINANDSRTHNKSNKAVFKNKTVFKNKPQIYSPKTREKDTENTKEKLSSQSKLKHLVSLFALVSAIIGIYWYLNFEPADSWTSKELTIAIISDNNSNNKNMQVQSAISSHICNSYKRVRLAERMHIETLIREYKFYKEGLLDPEKAAPISLVPVDIFVYITTVNEDNQLLLLMKIFYYKNGITLDCPDKIIQPKRISLQKEYLAEQLVAILKEKYPIRGRISEIEDTEISINIGLDVGVRAGMTIFKVIDRNMILKATYADKQFSNVEVVKGGIPLKVNLKVQAIDLPAEKENGDDK